MPPRRPESQEACFLAGADYRDFLGRAGLTEQRGEVVDEDGRRLGTHSGHWGFTPGQRRGIGVAAGKPLHVLRTEPAHNRVVVGERSALARTDVHASGSLFCSVDRAQAKLRYRSPAVSATVRTEAGRFPPRPRRACLWRRARPGGRPLRRRRGRRLRDHPALTRATTMPGMDEIVLIIPRERPFYGVAHLVLGGPRQPAEPDAGAPRRSPARAGQPVRAARRPGGRHAPHPDSRGRHRDRGRPVPVGAL